LRIDVVNKNAEILHITLKKRKKMNGNKYTWDKSETSWREKVMNEADLLAKKKDQK